MKLALTLTAALLLTACASGGYDSAGNETFAFDSPTQDPGKDTRVYRYFANNRGDLAAYCNDQRGYLSGDGQNCVVTIAMFDKRWCVQATVLRGPADQRWMNALCNGVRPSILPSVQDVL